MRIFIIALNCFLLCSFFPIGCGKKTPDRDYIPVIKNKLLSLQKAVKEKNNEAIDSLLSPDILMKQQGSDSLLSYVYGPEDNFAFEQFGNASIAYTTSKGRIDCFIMDSTHQSNRPFVLFLKLDQKLWLFTSFAPGETVPDSL